MQNRRWYAILLLCTHAKRDVEEEEDRGAKRGEEGNGGATWRPDAKRKKSARPRQGAAMPRRRGDDTACVALHVDVVKWDARVMPVKS